MADKLPIMLELERRGKLPPDKAKLLDEARRRGLVDFDTVDDDDLGDFAGPDGKVNPLDLIPGPKNPPGTGYTNEVPPNRTFGLSQSDTLNPMPAVMAGLDAGFSNIPIIGGDIQRARDEFNANVYGDTPADARADMEKNIRANPVPAAIGESIGKASPWIAAAVAGGPLAGALGLEGTLLSRIIWGSASNIALKTGDKMSEGEQPFQALGNASREGLYEAPFFALGTKSGRQATIANAPKTPDLFAEADRLYDAVRDSKLVIAQPSAKTFIDSAASKAMKAGLDEDLTPGSVAVVKRMQSMSGRNMSIEDAMLVRKLANDAYANAKPGSNDARIARGIVRDLDTFLEGVASKGPQGQANMAVVSGDAAKAQSALAAANKVSHAGFKAKTIDTAVELAIAEAEKSGRSLESTLKTEFGKLNRDIIKNGNPERFSKEEAKLIREVTNGSGGQRLAAFLGNTLYPKGPISVLPTLATGGSGLMAGMESGNHVLTALGVTAPTAIGALGRTLSSAGARESAEYAGANIRNKALGSNIVSGNALERSPLIKALPSVAGRTVTTMTLEEYAGAR